MRDTATIRIAIIAALERELHPLIKDWSNSNFVYEDRSYRVYQRDDVVALAGGIGTKAAEKAARATVASYQPEMLISTGFAGALIRSLKAGSVITPNVIVDGASGNEYRCPSGGGILVSAGEIAGKHSKTALVEKFHALAVDMEAAAVAEVARDAQVSFRCVKAISDEAHFPLPPLNQFVDEQGNFQSGKFAAWASVRPHQWPAVLALGRNSRSAARNLCNWLQAHLAGDFPTEPVVRLGQWREVTGEGPGVAGPSLKHLR